MQKMKWAVVPLTLAALAGGAAAAAGSATAAGTGNSNLDCWSDTQGGGPAVSCEVEADAVWLAYRITDLTTHQNNVFSSGTYFEPAFFTFRVTPGDKYKITVRTSNRITDTYRVTSDGDTTLLHAG